MAVMLVGAFGNAAGAALMPVFVGQAFNAVTTTPVDYSVIGAAAIGIIVSQIVRSVLQLGRNFGSEVMGQRLERDTRHELYASLIGKSMTFHDEQSVGDVMARATNDVREMNLMLNPGVNLVVGSFMFLIMPILIAPRMYPALILTPLIFLIVRCETAGSPRNGAKVWFLLRGESFSALATVTNSPRISVPLTDSTVPPADTVMARDTATQM